MCDFTHTKRNNIGRVEYEKCLTIYFCGTGSNQFDNSNENYWNGELVSTLAYNMNSREFADWIIIDGPGSGNLQLDMLWTEKVEYSDILGKLVGNGWEENTEHALNIIKRNVSWQRKKLSKEEYNILIESGIPLGAPSNVGSFFGVTMTMEIEKLLLRNYKSK